MPISDELYFKIITEQKKTPNILQPKMPVFNEGNQQLFVAPAKICGFAQQIVSNIDDHRHLKTAKILLLIKNAKSTAKKLDKGDRVIIGKAAMSNPREKLLTTIGATVECSADFIVWLSGDYLDKVNGTEKGATEISTDDLGIHKVIALIDHELSHCGVKIAGEYISKDILKGFIQDLGAKHIETCEKDIDDEGRVLVRYQHTDKKGRLEFMMRKHDIEEFNGVVGRHGAWSKSMSRLVDVMIKHQPTLFDRSLKQAS